MNQTQILMNEDVKSTKSAGRNSLKSNKSAQSRVSRYSKNSKKSRQSKAIPQKNPKIINITNFTKNNKSRSTKSVNKPSLIAISSILGATPMNDSGNSSIPNYDQINLNNQGKQQNANDYQNEDSDRERGPPEQVDIMTLQAVNMNLLDEVTKQNQGVNTQTHQNQPSDLNEMTDAKDQLQYQRKNVYGNLASLKNEQNANRAAYSNPKSNMQMSNLSLQVNSNNPLNQNSLAQIRQVNDNLQNVYFSQLKNNKNNMSVDDPSMNMSMTSISNSTNSHMVLAQRKINSQLSQKQFRQQSNNQVNNQMMNIQNISHKILDKQNKKIKILGKPQSLSFTKNAAPRAQTALDEHASQEVQHEGVFVNQSSNQRYETENVQELNTESNVVTKIPNRIFQAQIDDKSSLKSNSFSPKKFGRRDQNHLSLEQQTQSELMPPNQNQIEMEQVQNLNITYHQAVASSAQAPESRIMKTGKNFRPAESSIDQQNSKNLELNIQDESMIDMIVISQQNKSNKNGSVKSGKRSVCNSTSTTNKRKKSLNKRKQSINNNFGNIQQSQMKFNSIGQATKSLKMENEKLKLKKQGSIINKEDIAKTGGAASQVTKTYLRQTRQQGSLQYNTGSIKSPNNTGKHTQWRRQSGVNRNNNRDGGVSGPLSKIQNVTAERTKNDEKMTHQNLNMSSLTDYIQNHSQNPHDFSEIQDQSSILIKNLNNSRISQASELDDMQSHNAAEFPPSRNEDNLKMKHKNRSKVQIQQSIFDQQQFENISQIGHDHQITENLDKTYAKSKSKQNTIISQTSPHKLNDFLQQNILYSQTSKNNSISSQIGNEEEYQKTRKKNPSKSPNSNGRQGKGSRVSRQSQGRQSRQQSRSQMRKALHGGQTQLTTLRKGSSQITQQKLKLNQNDLIDVDVSREENTSQTRLTKKRQKQIPMTTTNIVTQKLNSGHDFQSESQGTTMMMMNEENGSNNIQTNRQIQKKHNQKKMMLNEEPFKTNQNQLQVNVNEAENLYQQELNEQQANLKPTKHLSKGKSQDETNQQKARKILKQSMNSSKNQHHQKKVSNQPTPLTYIFNNAQELKQQEFNLQNIGQNNILPRQSLGKPAAKLAALHSKYEDIINKDDIAAIKIKQVQSEHNFHNRNSADLYSQQLSQQNSQMLKKQISGKISSNSVQYQKRNAYNTLSSRMDPVNFVGSAQQPSQDSGSTLQNIVPMKQLAKNYQFKAYEKNSSKFVKIKTNRVHTTSVDRQQSTGSKKLIGSYKPQQNIWLQNQPYSNQLSIKKVVLKGVDQNQSQKQQAIYQNEEHNQSYQTDKVQIVNHNIFYQHSDKALSNQEPKPFYTAMRSQSQSVQQSVRSQSSTDRQDQQAQVISNTQNTWNKRKQEYNPDKLEMINQKHSNSQYRNLGSRSKLWAQDRRTQSALRNYLDKEENSLNTFQPLPQNYSLYDPLIDNGKNNIFYSNDKSPIKNRASADRNESSIQPSNQSSKSPFIENYGLLNRDEKSYRGQGKSLRQKLVKQIRNQKAAQLDSKELKTEGDQMINPLRSIKLAAVIDQQRIRNNQTELQQMPPNNILKFKSNSKLSKHSNGLFQNTQSEDMPLGPISHKNQILKLDRKYVEEDPLMYNQNPQNLSFQSLPKGRKSSSNMKDDETFAQIYGDGGNQRNLQTITKLKTRQVKLSHRIGSLNNSGHQISGFTDFDSSSNVDDANYNNFINSHNLQKVDEHDHQSDNEQLIEQNNKQNEELKMNKREPDRHGIRISKQDSVNSETPFSIAKEINILSDHPDQDQANVGQGCYMAGQHNQMQFRKQLQSKNSNNQMPMDKMQMNNKISKKMPQPTDLDSNFAGMMDFTEGRNRQLSSPLKQRKIIKKNVLEAVMQNRDDGYSHSARSARQKVSANISSEYNPKFANNYTNISQTGTLDSKQSINRIPSPMKTKARAGFQNRVQPKTSKKLETNAVNLSQQKSMRNYNNYISNNIIDDQSLNGSIEGAQFINHMQQPLSKERSFQPLTKEKSFYQQPIAQKTNSVNNRIQINSINTSSRGLAKTAQKQQKSSYGQGQAYAHQGQLEMVVHQQSRATASALSYVQPQNNNSQSSQAASQHQASNVMNVLQAFGPQASSPGSMKLSYHEAQFNKSQQKKAFNHLCTIENEQAHKNTITALCIAPYKADFNNFYDNQEEMVNDFNGKKKLFSSGLDSTIKCWNFTEQFYQDNIPSPSAPGYQLSDIQGYRGSNMSKYSMNATPLKSPFPYDRQVKYNYEYNEIQQNGRASQRVKVNSLVYFANYDLLVSGGTDRFINIYNNCSNVNLFQSMRYRCTSKITKQGSSVINKMCAIDDDKLIVGQSDEYIRLYQLSGLSIGRSGDDESEPSLPSSAPLATYKFEDSGINNLCSLNDKNLFISSGFNRSISVWDTRQTQPILFFKDIHYDQITSVDKFSQEIFASASDDGFVNIWDLRMGEFIKQLKVENNERISSIKFVNSFTSTSSSHSSHSSRKGYHQAEAQKYLLIAHADKVSVLSGKDNFTTRHTFRISGQGLQDVDESSVLNNGSWRINQMEFNEDDQTLYLGLQQNGRGSTNTISVWNLDLGQF